jgi:hypothetical protein
MNAPSKNDSANLPKDARKAIGESQDSGSSNRLALEAVKDALKGVLSLCFKEDES